VQTAGRSHFEHVSNHMLEYNNNKYSAAVAYVCECKVRAAVNWAASGQTDRPVLSTPLPACLPAFVHTAVGV
jgi:hypothetical protein